MNTWIDEAEKRQETKNSQLQKYSGENKQINQINEDEIKPFLDELCKFTERVAKIIPEERKPSLEIGFTHLVGENKYEFYGSAVQYISQKYLLVFRKSGQYMYWRRIFITITEIPGIVKITLYEKGTSVIHVNDIVKKKIKFYTKNENLSQSIIIHIIDWLVFKISTGELKVHMPSTKINRFSE
jgi:hypothetical protein